ncbi:MAG: DUF4147 domain-containing protein [Bacteriovoracaceae bacterium]|nr:DUF4147 domain-containing protein [Bacteriovoracaceae bacterium]
MKDHDVLFHLLDFVLPKNINFPSPNLKEFKVLGLGKAAPAHVFEYLENNQDLDHLVLTKESVPNLGLNCLYGEHPVAGDLSFENADKMIEWINRDKKDLLVLITGGASSIVEKLRPGVSKVEYKEKVQSLLSDGSTIEELNNYRKEVSVLKDGGLLDLIGDRKVETWVVQDVPGSDLSLVGSGPSLRDRSSETQLISSYSKLKDEALRLELNLIEEPLNCSLEEGLKLHLSKRGVTLSGGELPVNVKGEGRGGRNSHFVLSMAYELFEKNVLGLTASELSKVFISSLATDGDDGNSKAAGGFLDFVSWKQAKALGLSLEDSLKSSDSASYLQKLGCQYITGPTGTNIMDIRLVRIP